MNSQEQNGVQNGHNSYSDCSFETQAIHAGQDPEQWDSRCVVPPIVMSTTFKQFAPGDYGNYDYGRSGNPTRAALEACLGPMEKARYALTYASGLAALTNLNFLLKNGDHILCGDDVYGGTNRYLRNCASRMGIETTFVEMNDLKKTESEFRSNTAMVWLETPTNPTMKLIDIAAISQLAKRKNPNVIVVVDNTFASPYFQSPLEFGADIVTHSLTKYINGHTDVVMGAVMLNNEEIYKRLKFLQNAIGAVPSPFDCYMVNRGIKTLAIRMRQHMETGLKVAQALEKNPRVERVIYPGLPSHPQHELYKRQMKGFGGMMSVYTKGNLQQTNEFLKNLKLFALAESLGGYESLVEIPAVMTHASVPKEQRELIGLGDNLVRFSLGLENADDLLADIEQALEKSIPTN